jgi:gas vesicle protein
MKRATLVALGTGAIIGSAAAITIGSTDSQAEGFTRTEYESSIARVAAHRADATTQCQSLANAEREVCRAQASAEEMLRVADIEERYQHNDRASREAQRIRIDAQYQVERARCQSMSGFQKDKCLIQAHAVRGRALLQAHAPYESRN